MADRGSDRRSGSLGCRCGSRARTAKAASVKMEEKKRGMAYVGRADDGAVPVLHVAVVAAGQAIADCAIANAFFALFELFK